MLISERFLPHMQRAFEGGKSAASSADVCPDFRLDFLHLGRHVM